MIRRMFAFAILLIAATVLVNAANPVQAAGIAKVTTISSSVAGGKTVSVTVQLNAAAPSAGQVVRFQASNSYAVAPANVTIASGRRSVTVRFQTRAVTRDIRVTLTALAGSTSADVSVTLKPAVLTSLYTPTRMISGVNGKGTIQLDVPTAVDTDIALSSSDPAIVAVPASVTVPAGTRTASFAFTTGKTASGTATISATYSGVTKTDSTIVATAKLASIVTPTTIVVGKSATASVRLTGVIWSDLVVAIDTGDSPFVSVPSRVTIKSGTQSVTFQVTALAPGSVTIQAGARGVVKTDQTQVNDVGVYSLSIPTSLKPNATGNGTVRISGPAPAGGALVQLQITSPSNGGDFLTVGSQVLIPAGKDSQTFTLQAGSPGVDTMVTVTATLGDSLKTDQVLVKAAAVGIQSIVNDSPSAIGSNTNVTLTIRMTGTVQGADLPLSVTSSRQGQLPAPSTITVAKGTDRVTLALTSGTIIEPTNVTITVTSPAGAQSIQLTLYPVVVTDLVGLPGTMIGGGTRQVQLRISGPAPTGGAMIAMVSTDEAALIAPLITTIPQGATEVQVTLTTFRVMEQHTVVLAAGSAWEATAILRTVVVDTLGVTSIGAPPNEPITLASGQELASLPFTLSGNAPSDTTVHVTSSDPDALSVQDTVVVASGAQSGHIWIWAGYVSTTTTVTVTITVEGGGSRTLQVTILPPGGMSSSSLESADAPEPTAEATSTPEPSATPESTEPTVPSE